jgi:hypothetical protein
MVVIRSSETSVHIRTVPRYTSEYGNTLNYRCENLKFYNILQVADIIFVIIRVHKARLETCVLYSRPCCLL